MESRELMTNEAGDEFQVRMIVKRNAMRRWSCQTLELAEKSVELYTKENPKLKFSHARISTENGRIVKIIKL